MMQSQAWEFFQKTNCESVPFCLPSARLIDKTLFCDAHASVGITSPPDQIQSPEGTPSQALLPDKIKEKVVTTPGPQSQQLLDLAAQNKISDQALCPANRRSARKKDQLKWYKSSACASKNCLGCDVVPPTISPSIIKNLGASFCKVDADKLTVEALGKKAKWLPLVRKNSPRSPLHKILPMKMFPSPPRRSPRSEQRALLWKDSLCRNFICACPFFWFVILINSSVLNYSWSLSVFACTNGASMHVKHVMVFWLRSWLSNESFSII
jgi:hypothetical protein